MQNGKNMNFFETVADALHLDPEDAGIDELGRAARSLGVHGRREILAIVNSTLARRKLNERTRISAIKVGIALLPDSKPLLLKWLAARARKRHYENHFTIFCFLDTVQDEPRLRSFARQVPRLIRNYLTNVRSDTAMAAWMAGDLLGDHWSRAAGTAALLHVLRESKSPVGRKAAIHGLAHRVSKGPGRDRRAIAAALEEVALHDRDKAVRIYARVVLEHPSIH